MSNETVTDAYWVVTVNRTTGETSSVLVSGPDAADEAHERAGRANVDRDEVAFVVGMRSGMRSGAGVAHPARQSCTCDDWDVYDGYAECAVHPPRQ